MSDTPSATAELKLPKDLAAEKGMVNVQIDGVWHQFPKGTRMIEACRKAGTIVPHYCYHPKLSSPVQRQLEIPSTTIKITHSRKRTAGHLRGLPPPPLGDGRGEVPLGI